MRMSYKQIMEVEQDIITKHNVNRTVIVCVCVCVCRSLCVECECMCSCVDAMYRTTHAYISEGQKSSSIALHFKFLDGVSLSLNMQSVKPRILLFPFFFFIKMVEGSNNPETMLDICIILDESYDNTICKFLKQCLMKKNSH